MQIASAIRELAASPNSTWIAAALFEKTVQIWDLKSQTRAAEFPTVFCSGAYNLALAPFGRVLVAGLSQSRGCVAAYDVPSGKKIWEQKIVYPTQLRFHPSGRSIVCTSNRQSVLRLDVGTGNVLEEIDGARRHIEDASGDALMIPSDTGSSVRLIQKSGRAYNIDGPSPRMLGAEFSPGSVCLSESGSYLAKVGGSVRCFSRADGSLEWLFDPGPNRHVGSMHYSPGKDAFFGILWDFGEKGVRSLLKFDPSSGAHEQICQFRSWDEVFLDEDQLVTSAGEIRDLSDGTVVGRLSFPLREYPDDY